MAKKGTGRSAAAKKAKKAKKRATAKRSATRSTSNVQLLLEKGALDPDAERALDAAARGNIESLSRAEINALISAHLKISPRQRWKPDPDGSIF
jgi:hypothetical protein